jgi:hypothetical protein
MLSLHPSKLKIIFQTAHEKEIKILIKATIRIKNKERNININFVPKCHVLKTQFIIFSL